jgi:hydroxymethylpyrimidine pyrophosphatase-like HAD family hydrolase
MTRLDAGKLAELARVPFPITRMEWDTEAIVALEPHKIVVLTDDPDRHLEGASKALSAISQPLRPVIPAQHLVRGNFWFEYMPAAVNKSTTLARLAESLGLTLDECVAFGDSSNDYEMLRDAGMGIAMANAREDVKQVATYSSAHTNNEDGVGFEIEYLIEKGMFHEW